MQNSNKIKKMSFSALFVGILAIISQIYIPFVVPLTFQVFAVALCGYLLGAKWGTVSVAIYIILGVTGLPVFSGFKGGFGVLIEQTGGFIIGFIPLVFFCGLSFKSKPIKISLSFIGLIMCHLWGTAQFCIITGTGVWISFLTMSVPYIAKDIALLFTAYTVSKQLKI